MLKTKVYTSQSGILLKEAYINYEGHLGALTVSGEGRAEVLMALSLLGVVPPVPNGMDKIATRTHSSFMHSKPRKSGLTWYTATTQ